MSNEKRETNFSKIFSVEDLKVYLDNFNERLKNRDFLYHYTKLDRVVDIFESRKWHLGNAKCMNDRLEYANGNFEQWENIFFASFMTDVKESIAMWSMYAQPWEDGVLITIPKKAVVNWIKSVELIYHISCTDFKPTGKSFNVDNDESRVFLSSVAYSNCDNVENNEKLTWSNVTNTYIKKAAHIPELTGYIKDSAWDYEREIRLKAVIKGVRNISRVAIEIPDDILDSITITRGPLFEGNLEARLRDEIKNRVQISSSLFSNKLNISSACCDCEYQKGW